MVDLSLTFWYYINVVFVCTTTATAQIKFTSS